MKEASLHVISANCTMVCVQVGNPRNAWQVRSSAKNWSSCTLKAIDAGAHCERISGAGGGGFLMFLTDPTRNNLVADLLRRHEDNGIVYGCHFTGIGAQAWKVK